MKGRQSRVIVLVASCLGVLFLGARAELAVGQGAAQTPAGQRAGGARAGGQRQTAPPVAAAGRPIHVLFLGMDQDRPHNPAKMFPFLGSPLARRGIQLTYVADQAQALDPEKLKYYDVVMIYGNQTTITPAQEAALVGFVEGGKGLVALHSASAMFDKSDKYLSLVGGHFLSHQTGDFTAEFTQPNHQILQGLQPFTTWDETYVHDKHNTVNRTVLMERVDARGREPWTWVRTQGQGKVFYTAYGHDERTWDKPEFKKLVENAIIWTLDQPTRQSFQRFEMPGVTYLDGFRVPNYENRTPEPQYQLPFEPALAQRFMQLPAEFKLDLFVSEPDIVKPISMAFDERGRLWVIEAYDYPNVVLNGNPGNDKIKICEDTNGDGRADKFTIFADHINLATSLVFANGGVIVAAAPHMLFFKDTNGDDKSDVRQILSTGWGVNDTHAVASNLQYGPDNYIWGTVGYSGFRGTMNGKAMNFTQGAYRFRPDGSDFEYMVQATNNTWGIGFNETFDVFGSTANGDPSWYLGIPNRFFEGVSGLPGNALGRGVSPGYQSLANFTTIHYTTPYIRQVDQMGYYTAAAGHMMYTARAFPKEFWNRAAFVNEPTVHVTGHINIEPQGAGYVARDAWNLISSAEEWFAPVASMVGPDGAVWVDDFYNFIAQHNPTPSNFSVGKGAAYETSMRDRSRGRIYRVWYKGAAPQKKRSLSKANPAGLLEAITSDNMFWRTQAQRLLVERGQKDVVPQLIAIVGNTSVDAIGTNGGALHALWTLQGLGELNTTTTTSYRAAVGALKHPAAGVRKAAAMVLPKTTASAGAILSAGLLQDPELHTRLAATLVLAEMPASIEAGQALYKESQKADNFNDPWLSRALYIAATRHQENFLASYRGDPAKVPFSSLPVPLRMGAGTPDWRAPSGPDVAADWKDMTLPGNWEGKGLPDFDGIVWFTRSVDLAAGAEPDTISLGQVRNTARIWVNGVLLNAGGGRGGGAGAPAAAPPAAAPAAGAPAGQAQAAAAPAAGRGQAGAGRGQGAPGAAPVTGGQGGVTVAGAPPVNNIAASARAADLTYAVPKGTFRAGANQITVQVTNVRAEGGFVGTPADMYLATGQARASLAGLWKYRVERSSNAGALYSKPGELAAHVAFTAGGGVTGAAGATLTSVAAVPDVVLRLSTVPNEMKYALAELTVAPGQTIEVIYTNPDQMEHNFVLSAPGSLEQVGAAADALSQTPNAKALDYVPEVAQIIFKTKMLAPGQTTTFQFTAPAVVGDYPYICTYPNHWRIMNGVLHVVAPVGRGGGAGRGGAPAPATPAPGIGRGGQY